MNRTNFITPFNANSFPKHLTPLRTFLFLSAPGKPVRRLLKATQTFLCNFQTFLGINDSCYNRQQGGRFPTEIERQIEACILNEVYILKEFAILLAS